MYKQMLFNAYRGQNRASESQELELQAVESSAKWVLGTNVGSSVRATNTLNWEPSL